MSFVVAIDGPAAAGKSTTARRVADRLGFLYLDSGAMYRAVTWKVLDSGASPGDAEAVAAVARSLQLRLAPGCVEVDGRDVTEAIRHPQVTRNVSAVAAVPAVRREMVRLQREVAEEGPCVVEGRDIGSVVFPNAPVKIFLVASLTERAERRARELQQAGIEQPVGEIEAEIRRRDEIDSQRDDSPLVRPEGAVDLDTTKLTVDEQVEAVVALAEAAQARLARSE